MVLWESQLALPLPPQAQVPPLMGVSPEGPSSPPPLAVGAGDPQAGQHPGARQLGPSWPRLPVPPALWPAGAFPREPVVWGLRILRVWVCPLILERVPGDFWEPATVGAAGIQQWMEESPGP